MINQQLNYGAALFFAIIVLAVAFCQLTSKNYDASNAQVAKMLSDKPHFSYADLHRAIATQQTDQFVIIDLRSYELFSENHLPDAVNIPLEELLDNTHRRTLKRKKPVLLYAGEEHHAVAAKVLLLGKGYEDVRVIPGSFEIITKNVLEDFNPGNAFYSSDKARFDFPRFMSVQAIQPERRSQSAPLLPDAPEPTAIPGGC